MPYYLRKGEIPQKRHTIFKSSTGDFYHEQLFGTEGFNGDAALLYHLSRPTMISDISKPVDVSPVIIKKHNITPRKLIGFDIPPSDDYLESRIPLLVNNDVTVGVAAPIRSMTEYFYKNSLSDELLFIHKGKGRLKTFMGHIKFKYGDYLVIPKGVIYQLEFDSSENRILYLESNSSIYFPKRYVNKNGQFLESSPFCERDLKVPGELETLNEKGDFLIKIKKNNHLHSVVYRSHPFDVIGWDGYNYPFGFSIHDFEPITGRIHQPPPVHQTFEGFNFVVCSFCPRLYDYHPESIPAPYNHSNIDSDEVLYYVDGDFMSRNDVDPGHFTLHPSGIPHGPHPGAMERSIGKKETGELAVMIDTFKPLMLTEQAMSIDDGEYYKSWLE